MRIEGIFRIRLVSRLLLGELIAYTLVLIANAIVFFHYLNGAPHAELPVVIAKTLGHVICLNFGILVVLPQRNSIWVPLLGISRERMVKYHRIMGRVLFAAITSHLLAFWCHWIINGHILSPPSRGTWALMRASLVERKEVSVFCFDNDNITSLEFIRRTNFELFFYTHHIFLAVFGLAIYHTCLTQQFNEDMLLYWLIPGIIMYIIDLVIRFWRSRGRTQLISIVRDEATNIMLIKLRREGFKFVPGQYVYINFPQVSLLQWHPFSITSAPSESQARDTIITLAVRNMGGQSWTNGVHRLLEETLLPDRIKVRLDGPYGKMSIDLFNYPVLVLIAGGIGIAPLMSILNEYHNNPNLAFDKLYFIWCAKHQDYLAPFAHMLQDIEANDMLGKLEIHRYATRDFEVARRPHSINDLSQRGLSLSGVSGLNGRLSSTLPHQFTPGRPVLRDFFGRLVHRHPTSRMGVVVCGPMVMADDVAYTCHYLNKVHKPQIDLHRESFEI